MALAHALRGFVLQGSQVGVGLLQHAACAIGCSWTGRMHYAELAGAPAEKKKPSASHAENTNKFLREVSGHNGRACVVAAAKPAAGRLNCWPKSNPCPEKVSVWTPTSLVPLQCPKSTLYGNPWGCWPPSQAQLNPVASTASVGPPRSCPRSHASHCRH
jgi:hypothetical protein